MQWKNAYYYDYGLMVSRETVHVILKSLSNLFLSELTSKVKQFSVVNPCFNSQSIRSKDCSASLIYSLDSIFNYIQYLLLLKAIRDMTCEPTGSRSWSHEARATSL